MVAVSGVRSCNMWSCRRSTESERFLLCESCLSMPWPLVWMVGRSELSLLLNPSSVAWKGGDALLDGASAAAELSTLIVGVSEMLGEPTLRALKPDMAEKTPEATFGAQRLAELSN